MLRRFVKALRRHGLSASTIRNALMPLRSIYREAVADGDVSVNPTRDVSLPASMGWRETVAEARTGSALIAALAPADATLWAHALYTGLRRSELRGLRGVDVDLDLGVVHVRRAICVHTGELIDPKTFAGLRVVQISAALRPFAERAAARGDALAFGRDSGEPFAPSSVQKRADRQWRAAKLGRLTLHECRHTFASYLIAALVERGQFNPKLVQTLMGHSSIQVTYDRYGHLFPGSEDAARDALDAYLSGMPVP